jgi:hypothetical protein
MELNLFLFPDDAFHASRFYDLDAGVLKLDVVTQVYVVFSHCCFVQTMQSDVPVYSLIQVLLHCLLSNVICKCGKICIGQTSCSIETRIRDHEWNIKLYHLDKLAMVEHRINLGHCIQF